MQVKDLQAFEAMMKARGMNRGALCVALGISQPKWRRDADHPKLDREVKDRTLALAMSALALGLPPYPEASVTLTPRQ